MISQVEDQDDHADDGRENDLQGLAGPELVLERARPLDVHARRELDLLLHHQLGLLDEADLVAVADAGLDVGAEPAILALDHRRSLDDPDVGHLGQRDLQRGWTDARCGGRRARPSSTRGAHAASRLGHRGPGGDQDPLQGLDVVAVGPGITHPDRVTLPLLDGHGQGLAPHGHLDHVLDVAHLDAVAGRLRAVDRIST